MLNKKSELGMRDEAEARWKIRRDIRDLDASCFGLRFRVLRFRNYRLMAALTCLRSVETNLTLTCPSPKSFVCNLPDSGRHVTSVFQGLSLSLACARLSDSIVGT